MRHYVESSQRMYPTKKGIALNPVQMKTFLDAIIVVDAEVDTFLTANPNEVKYQSHLGYGTYFTVEIFNGYRYYDVRRYFIPNGQNERIPTKIGIKLRKDQVEIIKNETSAIMNAVPELKEIGACECMFQANQLGFLTCARCNPFDCINW